MAEAVLRGTSPLRSPVELVVSVAAETLHAPICASGGRPDVNPTAVGCFADGTCASIHATRRLACDCGVVEQIEDERGIVLSVGRRRRTIPGATKRALLRRDKTCRFPGCDNRIFLQGHHLKHWIDGGETSLENMVCLCTHHHRYVHEYGFTTEIDAKGVLTFFDPLKRVVTTFPQPEKPANRGWPAIRAANEHLQISAETPACGWTGERIDYPLQVDVLVHIDERAQRLQSP